MCVSCVNVWVVCECVCVCVVCECVCVCVCVCVQCAVCGLILGDLQTPMFLRGQKFHCETCYFDIIYSDGAEGGGAGGGGGGGGKGEGMGEEVEKEV